MIESLTKKYNQEIEIREKKLKYYNDEIIKLKNPMYIENKKLIFKPIINITLLESLQYVVDSYNNLKKLESYFLISNLNLNNIYIWLNYLYSYIISDLRNFFLKEVLIQLNLLITEEYPKISSLVSFLLPKKNIKKHKTIDFDSNNKIETNIQNIKSINLIKTKYLIFFLTYCKVETKEMKVEYTIYKMLIIHKNKKDDKKTAQAFIANICHGFGDAFIMQDTIYNSYNFYLYPIHDVLLCKTEDIFKIKKQINKSYNYVYNYMYYYPDLQDFYKQYQNNSLYYLNSYNIFKIK